MSTLVIGVGNRERGDDGAGVEVVRRLRAHPPANARLRECSGMASCLLETWLGQDSVIVIDAASGGGAPGSVQRFEAHRQPLPAALLHSSTHSWGVAEAVELARTLGQLPPRLIVYAIEGESFRPGRVLSPAVREAVERVTQRVESEVEGGLSASALGAAPA